MGRTLRWTRHGVLALTDPARFLLLFTRWTTPQIVRRGSKSQPPALAQTIADLPFVFLPAEEGGNPNFAILPSGAAAAAFYWRRAATLRALPRTPMAVTDPMRADLPRAQAHRE